MPTRIERQALEREFLHAARVVNATVEQLGRFASELTRVTREVGTEGKLGGQAKIKGVAGAWRDLTDAVSSMAGNLSTQVRNVAEVTTAVASGELSKKITVDVGREILQLKNIINTMVDQLRSFASEVARVAREVGKEGKLGGQADLRDIAATWKDLTKSVNLMTGGFTDQVRAIAEVVTAVANSDLTRKLLIQAKSEIAELTDSINSMIEALATFADQVAIVAREVGGTWRDLADNINRLAANLTTQLRGIADVATAVTKGPSDAFDSGGGARRGRVRQRQRQ